MDKQRTKFILQSLRFGSEDNADPEVAEALRQAGADPDLKAWLIEEQSRDQMIRRKLRDVAPPPGLRERLLDRHRAEAKQGVRSRLGWLAVAAVLVVLLSLSVMWWQLAWRGQESWSKARLSMVENLYRPLTFDFRSSDLKEIQAWLNTNAALTEVAVPPQLASLPSLGCRSLNVDGRPAVVICFLLDRAKEEAVHLFVMPAAGLTRTESEAVEFVDVGVFTTATWEEGGKRYMLAGRHSDALRALVPNRKTA